MGALPPHVAEKSTSIWDIVLNYSVDAGLVTTFSALARKHSRPRVPGWSSLTTAPSGISPRYHKTGSFERRRAGNMLHVQSVVVLSSWFSIQVSLTTLPINQKPGCHNFEESRVGPFRRLRLRVLPPQLHKHGHPLSAPSKYSSDRTERETSVARARARRSTASIPRKHRTRLCVDTETHAWDEVHLIAFRNQTRNQLRKHLRPDAADDHVNFFLRDA